MSQTFNMIAPLANETFIAQSGASYTSDGSCVVLSVAAVDAIDLIKSGCRIAGNLTDPLSLLSAKAITGAALTATATGGAMGFSITLGTSSVLVGEATSANAKTDTALFEYVLPSTYVAGTPINVLINANYTGSGTVTAASTTINAAIYRTAAAGTQGSNLVAGSAQQITGTAADYTIAVAGATLNPGDRIQIEPSLVCTTSLGAITGQVNSVRVQIP